MRRRSINAGLGNDEITLNAGNDIIQYANVDGNDTLYNFQELGLIHVTSGEYSTQTSGQDVIIKVGKGSINVKDGVHARQINIKDSNGDIKTIYSDQALNIDYSYLVNDEYSYKRKDRIIGTDKNDTIVGEYTRDKVNIYAGDGDNYIYGQAYDKVNIFAGTGKDSITLDNLAGGFIYAGAGRDHIYANGAVINAGAGNDEIHIGLLEGHTSYGLGIEYGDGDGNGNDIVYYHRLYESNAEYNLHIIGDSYSTQKSGDDLLVKVGSGSIKLKDFRPHDSVSIQHTKAMYTSADKNNFNGTSNADLIYSVGGNNSTVNAGAGNDTIVNRGINMLINGDDGNDSITNFFSGSTITGGKGDDTIYLSGDGEIATFDYSDGDGNDVIVIDSNELSQEFVLNINADSYSTQSSGDDTIVKVGNGSIRLKVNYLYLHGATITQNHNIVKRFVNINNQVISGSPSNDSIENYNGQYNTINAGDGDDKIRNFTYDGFEVSHLLINGDNGLYNCYHKFMQT